MCGQYTLTVVISACCDIICLGVCNVFAGGTGIGETADIIIITSNHCVAVVLELLGHPLELSDDGCELVYTFNAQGEHTGIAALLQKLNEHGVHYKDIQSTESSLEEIFVSLVNEER